jgi:serine protease SohB
MPPLISELLIFSIETTIIVVGILIVFAGLLGIAGKNKSKSTGKLIIKNLNEKYKKVKDALQQEILSKDELKQFKKESKLKNKLEKKEKNNEEKPRLFVLDFTGDIKASGTPELSEEISALLAVASPKDEVLVRLDSPGGLVHAYGLAASQLQRIKDHKIPLTVAIDKMAASGGYLMATVADKIIAAPFAVIGSIGAVAQLPNFHRFLKKNNIDYEMFTAGEFKRTVTLFGENSSAGRKKLQSDLEDIHSIFKEFIETHRPEVNISEVATGEHWLATKAFQRKLVDVLSTSDEYISSAIKKSKIIHLQWKTKKKKSLLKCASKAKMFINELFNPFQF